MGQGPGPWLLPWLCLKRNWYLGTEHQLGLGSLLTDGGKKDHPKLLQIPAIIYYPSWPAAGEAGSAPEMEERQPGQELRQHKALYVTKLP